jgi:cytoskeletal protein CcmA (bactofilin family)
VDPGLPSTEITALLGRGTHFEGKLHFDGRVRIDGSFRGGTVNGNVRAWQSIELYVPAKVSGTLHSPEIYMDKGVQFSGTCTMAPL